MKKLFLTILICCCAGYAQDAQLTFEVASIRPTAPPQMMSGGRIMIAMGKSGGPGTKDPTRITYNGVSLGGLLMEAYDAKRFQVTGPAWLDSERFDIKIKAAEGTTKEQYQVMLQNLLAERFKLTMHREKKEMPIYELMVGKNGLKMKESVEEPPATGSGPADGDGAPAGAKFSFGPGDIKLGKDGFPVLPPAASGAPRMMVMNGRARLQGQKTSMADLAVQLSRNISRPVIDATGLTGKYDFTLTFAQDNAGRPGMMMPPPPPGGGGGVIVGGGGGGDFSGPSAADGDSGPTIFAAVQEQLGLKLESKKGQVDMVVVDHLEKTPTEN